VQKPGRYVGGEWNAVKKDWADDKLKVCLAFPDVYEIGMSYLGIKILYGILNNRDDCLCERVFAPWKDFETVLRNNDIKLFSLESRRSLKDFDIVGFSLAYELGYTNLLNMLNLGGIPINAMDRGDDDPVVIAGGPSCYNPEPVAEFIDAFVIGDGEDVINEIVDVVKASGPRAKRSRKEILKELSKIKGVYVPSFYKTDYNPDGTISGFCPTEAGVPEKIEKRFVKNLDEAFYPTKQIVPNIQIVHDRIAIEIMRGCKHACRFCQASATYRPCRERSRKNIVRLAKESYAMTGYDEVSLLSLSSIDHSELVGIIEDLNREFSGKAVSISVPSLRIEENVSSIPVLVSKVKKSGLTFAPEAGSDRMRKILGKNISVEKLSCAALESFRAGWKHVKLYFMIGLPGEEEADLSGIAAMVQKISDLKRDVDGHSANITLSINAFVPKPHTDFELNAMDRVDTLEKKRNFLRNCVKSKMVKMDFHSYNMSRLEAVFSRGDRRLSCVINKAWEKGARFDGWQDVFNFDIWVNAFQETGRNPDFYTTRPRDKSEMLPWGFIHT
jgi:radical SAM family uncharacterized protein